MSIDPDTVNWFRGAEGDENSTDGIRTTMHFSCSYPRIYCSLASEKSNWVPVLSFPLSVIDASQAHFPGTHRSGVDEASENHDQSMSCLLARFSLCISLNLCDLT
jgi:hypothetical protein